MSALRSRRPLGLGLLYAVGLLGLAIHIGSRTTPALATPAKKCTKCDCREWEGFSFVTKTAGLIYLENTYKVDGNYYTIPSAHFSPFYSTTDLCDLTPGEPYEATDETVQVFQLIVVDGVPVCDGPPDSLQIELLSWKRSPDIPPPPNSLERKRCGTPAGPQE
jgi:hypothetical protein